MASHNVTNADEFINACRTISSAYSVEVNVMNDIDFNDSNFYFNIDNFVYNTSGDRVLTIHGNGHTLSNIYIYPGKTFIGVGNLVMDNIKIETISDNAYILNNSYNDSTLTNCTFNAKIYNFKNSVIPFHVGNYSGSSSGDHKIINCIFNIFIASMDSSSSELPILLGSDTSGNSNRKNLFLEACIFKIRNNTDRFFTFFANRNNYGFEMLYIDNCAFFYNDVGISQPPYDKDDISYSKFIRLFYGTYPSIIKNTYFASFGSLRSGMVRPQILAITYNNPSSFISSSFFDKEKLSVFYQDSNNNARIEFPDTGYNMFACTTENCKNGSYLSSVVGYIFAEES